MRNQSLSNTKVKSQRLKKVTPQEKIFTKLKKGESINVRNKHFFELLSL